MTERGRPTKFTPELGERICNLVATHPWGLKRLCMHYADLPHESTIRLWKLNNRDFFAQYARAKAEQADFLAEDILDIADDDSRDNVDEGSIARARLKIDTRKWIAAKLLPKIYGAKYILDQKNEEDKQVTEEIRQLRKHLDEKNKRDY